MKTKVKIQRLVKLAFGQSASIQHRRYAPSGVAKEGFWIFNTNTPAIYAGYSKTIAVSYLTDLIDTKYGVQA